MFSNYIFRLSYWTSGDLDCNGVMVSRLKVFAATNISHRYIRRLPCRVAWWNVRGNEKMKCLHLLELIARRKLCKNVDLEMELWKMGLVVCWRALDRFLIRKNWALVARGKDDKDRCMGNTRKRRRERIEFDPRLLFLCAPSISLNGCSFFCCCDDTSHQVLHSHAALLRVVEHIGDKTPNENAR